MQLLIQSVMVFFGTLLAAGLLALAEPGAPSLAKRVDDAAARVVLLAGAEAPAATAHPQR